MVFKLPTFEQSTGFTRAVIDAAEDAYSKFSAQEENFDKALSSAAEDGPVPFAAAVSVYSVGRKTKRAVRDEIAGFVFNSWKFPWRAADIWDGAVEDYGENAVAIPICAGRVAEELLVGLLTTVDVGLDRLGVAPILLLNGEVSLASQSYFAGATDLLLATMALRGGGELSFGEAVAARTAGASRGLGVTRPLADGSLGVKRVAIGGDVLPGPIEVPINLPTTLESPAIALPRDFGTLKFPEINFKFPSIEGFPILDIRDLIGKIEYPAFVFPNNWWIVHSEDAQTEAAAPPIVISRLVRLAVEQLEEADREIDRLRVERFMQFQGNGDEEITVTEKIYDDVFQPLVDKVKEAMSLVEIIFDYTSRLEDGLRENPQILRIRTLAHDFANAQGVLLSHDGMMKMAFGAGEYYRYPISYFLRPRALGSVAQNVLLGYESLSRIRNIEISVDSMPQDLANMQIDDSARNSIQTMLGNLVMNGIKYRKGADELAPGEKSFVRLSFYIDGEYLVIVVRDNGRGMSPEDLFSYIGTDRPWRSAAVRAKVFGEGLGIRSVKYETKALGGTFSAESTLGKGPKLL